MQKAVMDQAELLLQVHHLSNPVQGAVRPDLVAAARGRGEEPEPLTWLGAWSGQLRHGCTARGVPWPHPCLDRCGGLPLGAFHLAPPNRDTGFVQRPLVMMMHR